MDAHSIHSRYTLRDLPLPAKLVVTCFLISVGLGYLWAMAQIHFKHASPGNPMPTIPDLVARFSGVPWPLEPKPAEASKEDVDRQIANADAIGVQVPAIKIKTVINTRCAWCHSSEGEKDDKPLTNYDEIAKFLQKTPEYEKGHLHTVITGSSKNWNRKSMVRAFTDKAADWEDLTDDQREAAKSQREAERLAMVAWVEASAPKANYEADAFPLPQNIRPADLHELVRTTAAPLAPAAVGEGKKPVDKWKEARLRRLSVDALTQSTHAHLLSFAVLWSITGIIFAFTSYSSFLRCVLAPLVLVAQVLDVACWWLARLDGIGPYFALAILGTGAVVGLGLGAQITLSLFNMYGKKGKAVLMLIFLIGASLFALTYVKVIEPQLQEEKDFVAKQAK